MHTPLEGVGLLSFPGERLGLGLHGVLNLVFLLPAGSWSARCVEPGLSPPGWVLVCTVC